MQVKSGEFYQEDSGAQKFPYLDHGIIEYWVQRGPQSPTQLPISARSRQDSPATCSAENCSVLRNPTLLWGDYVND